MADDAVVTWGKSALGEFVSSAHIPVSSVRESDVNHVSHAMRGLREESSCSMEGIALKGIQIKEQRTLKIAH